jgi:hypothetical protein
MSAAQSIIRNSLCVIATTLALGTAADTLAAPVGHAVMGGGYHGGGFGGSYRGWAGGRAFYGGGWRGYYGGWRGYYGPWRGGWAGWRWGCCGWSYPWVPLGWYVPVLPWGYRTLWWGGVPYYYSNNYYYVWDSNAGQYEAVQPPSAGATPPNSSPPSPRATPTGNTGGRWTDLYAYPKGGQSTEQQMKDRDECRKWAVEQSGFDPSQPTHDSGKDWTAKRDSYLRAEGACLQARNYSVK